MMSLPLSKKICAYSNDRGQMAIFVALIFQILFIFFAMAINIGLVVHDKINLQNAVDLSAYYAVQRQAEMLNVIAHTNYQIRQSWKLLNWRYWVLGTMGSEDTTPPHPTRGNAPRTEQPWTGLPQGIPAICTTYGPVWRNGQLDNPCKSQNFNVPNIEIPVTIAPFLPFNILFAGFARGIQKSIQDTCNGYGGTNWLFAASVLASYMMDQQNRKELIRGIARNLARPPEAIIDLNGDSIWQGARQTFEKNLTAPNRSSIVNFEILNSLQDVPPSDWLNEIDIWFSLMYQDLVTSGSGCAAEVFPVHQEPSPASWQSLLATYGPTHINALLQLAKASASFAAGSSQRLSLGVEKNPWVLAYMGVKATTRPRQLFFPFGEPVEFSARAFAQPFGGRIGPWFGRTWSRGAQSSEGPPLQLGPDKLQAGGIMNSSDPKLQIPQYSRFPGDQLGLRSIFAQNSLIKQLGIRTTINDYKDIFYIWPGGANDVLAYSPNNSSNVRQYELAAIAPDLFDITYYSIQPNFGERYLERLRNARGDLGITDAGFPRGDLGSREPNNLRFSVRDQMQVAQGLKAPNTAGNLQALDAYWYVRKTEHLLTSWVHDDAYGDYVAFPIGRFGRCLESDEKYEMKAPGGCMDTGGRAGYSVKLISPEMFRAELELGGQGQGAGTILNPPPDDW